MATYTPLRGHAAELTSRRGECHVFDRLIDAVRAGVSRAVVARGEPGVGKTALSRLDVIDAGRLTREKEVDGHAAPVTSWWGGGCATARGAPS